MTDKKFTEKYLEAEIEIIRFSTPDILTGSDTSSSDLDPNEQSWGEWVINP